AAEWAAGGTNAPSRKSAAARTADRSIGAVSAIRPELFTPIWGPFRMATRDQLDFTYSLTDRVIRLSLGELADFSGAKYDGDFSLSLEQAQRRKHDYVAQQIGIGPGRRVLDLGCGWGGLLAYIRELGAAGVGVTLSSAQLKACRRHGL